MDYPSDEVESNYKLNPETDVDGDTYQVISQVRNEEI